MKLSELHSNIAQVIETHGDLDVHVWDGSGPKSSIPAVIPSYAHTSSWLQVLPDAVYGRTPESCVVAFVTTQDGKRSIENNYAKAKIVQ